MEGADDPDPTPRENKFKGKRSKSRKLSYKRRRGDGNQKSSATYAVYRDDLQSTSVAPQRPSLEEPSLPTSSRAAKRKILPRKIKSLLDRKCAEVNVAHETISKQARAMESLSKKKDDLIEVCINARQTARETQKQASVEMAKMSSLLRSKEAELVDRAKHFEEKVDEEVTKAITKEEVSL